MALPLSQTLTALALAHEAGITPDKVALERAMQQPGPLRVRILTYFTNHNAAPAMQKQLARLNARAGQAGLLLLLLGLLAGGATARTALSPGLYAQVNIYFALLACLGLPLLSLFFWLVMIVRGSDTMAQTSIGGAVVSLIRRAWRGNPPAAALAMFDYYGRGGALRWSASVLSHLWWTGFALGTLGASLILLSLAQIYFVWETTLLSASAYASLTAIITAPLSLLGVAVPTSTDLAASRFDGSAPLQEGFVGWTAIYLSALLVYGLIPRLIALGLSVWRLGKNAQSQDLDPNHPVFQHILPHLAARMAERRVVTAPTASEPPEMHSHSIQDIPVTGPISYAGWELDPTLPWPPPGLEGRDLGLIDGRAACATAVSTLKGQERLIILADAQATPDRGVSAGLQTLAQAAGHTDLWLTNTARMDREWTAPDAHARREDWILAAHRAGLDPAHVHERDPWAEQLS